MKSFTMKALFISALGACAFLASCDPMSVSALETSQVRLRGLQSTQTPNSDCKTLIESVCTNCTQIEDRRQCFKDCFDEYHDEFEEAGCKPPKGRGQGGNQGGQGNKPSDGGQGQGGNQGGQGGNQGGNQGGQSQGGNGQQGGNQGGQGQQPNGGNQGQGQGQGQGGQEPSEECKTLIDSLCGDCADSDDIQECMMTCFEENQSEIEEAGCEPQGQGENQGSQGGNQGGQGQGGNGQQGQGQQGGGSSSSGNQGGQGNGNKPTNRGL